jgi:hypothetical protein
MFGDFNLEDFYIFNKLKPCSIRSLLINYIKMFNLVKSDAFNHLFKVENQHQNVDSTLFLRIQDIDVYCYR